jgi:hypothetical protein
MPSVIFLRSSYADSAWHGSIDEMLRSRYSWDVTLVVVPQPSDLYIEILSPGQMEI